MTMEERIAEALTNDDGEYALCLSKKLGKPMTELEANKYFLNQIRELYQSRQ